MHCRGRSHWRRSVEAIWEVRLHASARRYANSRGNTMERLEPAAAVKNDVRSYVQAAVKNDVHSCVQACTKY